MTRATLDTMVAEIEGLMSQRLRVRGKDLATQIRKAGRLLPRPIAREARYLAQARTYQQSPKLSRMIDDAHVTQAYKTVRDYLKAVDPAERRKDRILGFLGIFAFQFLLIAAAMIAFLRWRGYV